MKAPEVEMGAGWFAIVAVWIYVAYAGVRLRKIARQDADKPIGRPYTLLKPDLGRERE